MKKMIFDSTKDDWKINTSVFDSKILNKKQLIFIVEDTEGNKFGGYINEKIDKIREEPGDEIIDSKSFVFSLESNGRLNCMKKFNIKQPQYAFRMFSESYYRLFSIGLSDIYISKKGSKHYCFQSSLFNYEGIEKYII